MHTPVVAYLPGTDDLVRSHSHEELWALWLKECNARGIALDNPKAQFQDCCCRALPPEKRAKCCAYVDESSPALLQAKKLITGDSIFEFFDTVKDWWRSEETVTQEVADQRAAVCALCPLNADVHLAGCPSCTNFFGRWAGKLFNLIGNKRTSSNDALKACLHCGCDLRLLVHVPLDAIQKNQKDIETTPVFCWKRG